jgi:phosphoribosylformimino-5-aminoimidazole carboxamide ribonucleotide (ProFAR) isomerase
MKSGDVVKHVDGRTGKVEALYEDSEQARVQWDTGGRGIVALRHLSAAADGASEDTGESGVKRNSQRKAK